MPPRTSSSLISFKEKLDLLPVGFSVLLVLLYNLLTGLVRGRNGAYTYRLHVARGVLQRLILRLSTRQIQYLLPSTPKMYQKWASASKTNQPQTKTVPLKDGASGHWIGDKNAKNVLIYYHGGGFALPATAGHFTFYSRLLTSLNKQAHGTNNDIAIFFLSYTLTPHAVYPTQLSQGVDALRYILKDTNRSASNVFLGGDSAGGNLAFCVLSHLSHPHPDIVPLPLGSTSPSSSPAGGAGDAGTGGGDDDRLAGVFGIAPWVTPSTDPSRYLSMQTNRYKDIITAEEAAKWGGNYVEGSTSSTRASSGAADPWREPLGAPTGWWADFRAKGVFVAAGGDEILLSSVEAFVNKIRADLDPERSYEDVVFAVGEHESHVPMVYLEEVQTQQAVELERWLSGRLGSL